MKLTPVLVITTIVGIGLGAGFILIPDTVMGFLTEDPLSPAQQIMTRLYGSSTLFVGLVALVGLWFDSVKQKRLITYALLGFMLPHAGLAAYGTVIGAINSTGWGIVGVMGIQGLLYALSLLRSDP